MFLIDSSIYIGWIRQRTDPVAKVVALKQRGPVFCCGVIRVAVLRDVRSAKLYSRLSFPFDSLSDIETGCALWESVTELAWTLDRQGKGIPLSGLIIGSCAMKVGAVVVTEDRYFLEIPGLEVVPGA